MADNRVRDIALGYGSKWHLLRYLGWHQKEFSTIVRGCVPGLSEVRWLDQHFTGKAGKSEDQDAELQGLEFLKPPPPAWNSYWPQTGRPPTWDAIGEASINGTREWLLVEAKAHIGELASSTGASEDSQAIIQRAMEETQQAMGVDPGHDWLKGYYQYANRLAVLHFLRREGIPARLLFIYFWGDRPEEGPNWPQTENEWEPPLREMEKDLGLEGNHQYSDFIHKLFLPVTGASDGVV